MASDTNGFPSPPNDILFPLAQLQSKGHEEILNIIDQLRSEGISKYVDLPQLIVCGDQSSGKSSVLEAISGLAFPVKDNVCTRFATELILRRSSTMGVMASIHPDADRSPPEQERFKDFKASTVDLNQFSSIVKEAENFIGVCQDGHQFSKDVLRVEVCGPTQPHLTLVDLPGLYHASDQHQSATGVGFVESLVMSYIQNKRSVILAVISAKSEIPLQKVTTFTLRVDPEGRRTMGIITKPDTLPEGSDMERSFYDLAMNTRLTFRLGWHVLKNREHKELHFSLDQRHESEARFLSSGIWEKMPRSLVGIETLRPRLSNVLKDHIISELPGLIGETQQSFEEASARIERLGAARETLDEQRQYLQDASERFTVLLNDAINGIYFRPFFGDAMDDEGYQRRLRAVVQNRLSDLSETLYEDGMQTRIIDNDDGDEIEELDQNQILRSDFVDEVKQRMRRSRGKELPGMYNPLIIGDLFYVQSRPWKSIVTHCVDELLQDVHKTIAPILQETMDDKSTRGLMEHVISPGFEKIEEGLRSKVTELLKPQQSGHPITYNHYFIDSVQKAREDHLRKTTEKKLKAFFTDAYPSHATESFERKYTFRMDSLIESLAEQTGQHMEQFAASEAIDCMLAYYKVARKKFGDDFSVLAVENCLLEPIALIFCSRVVTTLPDPTVEAIAAEDESSRVERKRLEKKISTLKTCLHHLHRFDRRTIPVSNTLEENIRFDGDSMSAKENNSSALEDPSEMGQLSYGLFE